MSAPLPEPVLFATDETQFLVSHGKSGVIGVFTGATPESYVRGQSVIVQTSRGVELGTVLGPASIRQARIFGAASSGLLMRRRDEQDEARCAELRDLEQQIFEQAQSWAAFDILDVDLFFDGQHAIVQFVGAGGDTEPLALALEQHFRLTIHLENLAPVPDSHEHHHCDKPDCGRDAGGCSSCSTGGGCSSCGSSKVDLREYFAHLRTQMEVGRRIPLA